MQTVHKKQTAGFSSNQEDFSTRNIHLLINLSAHNLFTIALFASTLDSLNTYRLKNGFYHPHA